MVALSSLSVLLLESNFLWSSSKALSHTSVLTEISPNSVKARDTRICNHPQSRILSPESASESSRDLEDFDKFHVCELNCSVCRQVATQKVNAAGEVFEEDKLKAASASQLSSALEQQQQGDQPAPGEP